MAILALPGLLAVEPVLAAPREPEPESGVPELPEQEPEQERALPAAPTASDVVVPVSAATRTVDDFPEPARELVGQRDARTEVWENVDGTRTVTIHDEPVHYRPEGSSSWKRIDNSLVEDPARDGWVRNTGNDWTVRFGPVGPGGVGGVELTTDAGPVRVAPELPAGRAPVEPVVGTGEQDDTVTYPDVWPGVDVRYTVSGGRVKEDVVVGGDAEAAAFPFVTEGLGLVEAAATPTVPSAVEVTGRQGDEVGILAPEVIDADGELARDDAEAAYDVAVPGPRDGVVDTSVAGAPQRLTVSVDEAWLDDQLAEGPVVIDPTMVVLDGFFHVAHRSDGVDCGGCGVRVGNSQGGGGGAATNWRTNGGFSYWSSIAGKDVMYAGVWIAEDPAVPQSSAPQPVKLWWATGNSYAGAVANGDTNRLLGTQTVDANAAFDVTEVVNGWQAFGLQSEAFGFSGAETTCTAPTTACYTYRSFDAALVLNVSSPPPAPGLVAPANDSLAIATATPTLKWGTVTDPDGDPVTYTARLSTGTDGESGLVATGPTGSATTWTVPAGVLRDGVTYYWAVRASDGHSWTKSTVRRFTVDRSGVSPPTEDAAGMSTNLVNGRGSFGIPGVSLPTVGGGIGVGFAYDTQAPAGGLRGTYRVDEDQDHVIDATDDVVLARDDAQVSFAWAGSTGGAASPAPGVPAEDFSAVWEGTIAIPSGTWKLGARADDGVRIYLDGSSTPVVDDWTTGTMPSEPVYQSGTVTGGVHDIKVEYFQATGAAGVELWAKDTGPDPDVEVVVPAGWLSAEPRVLPPGWRLEATDAGAEYRRAEITEGSVTLFRPDGTAVAFPKTAFELGYAPPKGNDDVVVPNLDGTILVHAASGAEYLFNPDGSLAGSTTPLDEGTTSARPVPDYDAAGRLVAMTDPVSEQEVSLHYGPDAACQEEPPILGGGDFGPIPAGMLCKVAYWDGTATHLYYRDGRLGYVRNPGDAYWGLGYDGNGRLTSFHDPVSFDAAYSGARTDWEELFVELTYDTAGRITGVSSPPPLQGDDRPGVTYAYAPTTNAHGELTGGTATVTRAGMTGTYRSVAYDSRGRTTGETDAAGLVTTTVWDGDDRITRVDQPGGLRSTTLYDVEGLPTDDYGPAPAAQFNPDGTGQAGVPHASTDYDEGIDGLAVVWWPNVEHAGIPAVHQHDPGSLDSNWGTGSPAPGIPTDNFTGRYTGDIVFPTAGTYALRLERDSKLAFYLDDVIRIPEWGNTSAGFSAETSVTAAAGDSHRLRIEYGDTTGSAKLKLQWKTPGSSTWATVPGSALRPGYGLVTSTTDANGDEGTVDYTDSGSGLGIEHGVPTAIVTDPGGLGLTASTRYETGGHRRPLAAIMPSGAERTFSYYGDTETRNNPCTTGDDPANQAGRQKLSTAPDPDGSGSATAITTETIHDATGRPVATRVGSEPWTCTSYDSRGRVVRVEYPAFGGAPARTVDYDHAADPDGSGPEAPSPLVTSITDPVGTILTAVDLAGDAVSQTDVFGHTTTFERDDLGRPTTSTGPAGTIEHTYDSTDRLTSLRRNGQVVAANLVYDTTDRLTGVTYPSGSGNAGNGTAGTFGYDTLGRPSSVTWTGPGSTSITSDAVTRDAGDRIVDQTIDGTDPRPGGPNFTYDEAGHLTEAWVPGARYQYGFGQNGFCVAPDSYKNSNRSFTVVTPTGGSPTTTHYCYDHADRLDVATDPVVGTITYDAHGNTTGIFGGTHTYDAADRHLTTTKGATTVTYVRDALDRIVERRVGSTITARYGYTGGDATSFVTDGSNAVVAVTLALPGGAMLTATSGGNTWSYPNVHGDHVATANQSGAKQGPTTHYDPFGNVVAGALPDNSPGNMDHGWLGHHQRPLEHEPTLQPVVEMGARQYSPLLGRFLEVDPVPGGSCNAYEYVCGDPVNDFDTTGTVAYKNRFAAINCSWGSCTIYLSKASVRGMSAAFRRKGLDGYEGSSAVTGGFCGAAGSKKIASWGRFTRSVLRYGCIVGAVGAFLTVIKRVHSAARRSTCVQWRLAHWEMAAAGVATILGGGWALAGIVINKVGSATVSNRSSKCHDFY